MSSLPNVCKDDLKEEATNKEVFPYKLGPFGISVSDFKLHHFETILSWENEPGFFQIDVRQFKHEKNAKQKTLKHLIAFIEYISTKSEIDSYGIVGSMSPSHRVTLDDNAKKAANIPINARYFSWAYPSVLPKDINLKNQWLADPNIIFLTVGGYMYFDNNFQLLQINTLVPAVDGGLQFGKPKKWDSRFTYSLHKQGRFQDITLDALSSTGAKYFAWIFPKEILITEKGEKCAFTEHGGFVYLFHDIGNNTNMDLCKMDRYFEILAGNDYRKSDAEQKKKKLQNPSTKPDTLWRITWLTKRTNELQTLKAELLSIKKDENNKNDKNNNNNINNNNMNALNEDFDSKENYNGNKQPVESWDQNSVSLWLEENHLNQIKPYFYNKHINGKQLINLSDNEMKHMIHKLSENEKDIIILNTIKKLRNTLISNERERINILKKRIKDLENEIDAMHCIICSERKKSIMFTPCKHITCCDQCSDDLDICPICRITITKRETAYF